MTATGGTKRGVPSVALFASYLRWTIANVGTKQMYRGYQWLCWMIALCQSRESRSRYAGSTPRRLATVRLRMRNGLTRCSRARHGILLYEAKLYHLGQHQVMRSECVTIKFEGFSKTCGLTGLVYIYVYVSAHAGINRSGLCLQWTISSTDGARVKWDMLTAASRSSPSPKWDFVTFLLGKFDLRQHSRTFQSVLDIRPSMHKFITDAYAAFFNHTHGTSILVS